MIQTTCKLNHNVLRKYLHVCVYVLIYINIYKQNLRMREKYIIFVFYFNIVCYSQIFYNEHRLVLKLGEKM